MLVFFLFLKFIEEYNFLNFLCFSEKKVFLDLDFYIFSSKRDMRGLRERRGDFWGIYCL